MTDRQIEKFKVKLTMTKIMEVDPTSYPVEMGILTKEQMIEDTKQSILQGELWVGDIFDGSDNEIVEVVAFVEEDKTNTTEADKQHQPVHVTVTIAGFPGSGKTTLMNKIEKVIKKHGNYENDFFTYKRQEEIKVFRRIE